jgi:hypothetical protein
VDSRDSFKNLGAKDRTGDAQSLVALMLFQRLRQPIVEAIDFHHRQGCFPAPEKIPFRPLQELPIFSG